MSNEVKNGFSRRDFLKVVGASTGAMAVGCTQAPVEKIIPYVVRPNEVIPGVATWYAASCGECSAGCGTLIRTREGRVVKVEGNQQHPLNQGGLCALGQSSLQTLYDPDRIREPLKREAGGAFKPVTWNSALDELADGISKLGEGKKALFITERLSGSEKTLLQEFSKQVKGIKHIEFELLGRDVIDVAAQRVFGPGVTTAFDFSKADVVLSVGAGFLETWLSPVEYARQWAERRKPENNQAVSYFIQIEPRLSLTAANADVWLKNAPGTEEALLGAMLKLIGEQKTLPAQVSSIANNYDVAAICSAADITQDKLKGIVKRLVDAKSSLVVAGPPTAQSVEAAMLANLINLALGNLGKSVVLRPAAEASMTAHEQMAQVISELTSETNSYDIAFICGPNLSYVLPNAIGFRAAIAKLKIIATLAYNLDETANVSNIVLPRSTNFEAWNDAEVRPGLRNLNQPAMQPLYRTQGLGDTLIALADKMDVNFDKAASFYDFMRSQWRKHLGEANFEQKWTDVVRSGLLFNKNQQPNVPRSILANIELKTKPVEATQEFSLLAFPTAQLFDGRAANRAWAQEIPDTMSAVVWGSWVEIHPDRAQQLNVKQGDIVSVQTEHGTVQAPAYLRKHMHANVVAIPIGQGHQQMGRYANGVGANVLAILPAALVGGSLSMVVPAVKITTSPWVDELVRVQDYDTDLGRGYARKLALSKYNKLAQSNGQAKKAKAEPTNNKFQGPGAPHFGSRHDYGPTVENPRMYEQMEHPVYRWGMSIDLASCTGCSACVTACYAENNIPVVGKEFAKEGREMSWLQIQRYLDGPDESPANFVPMLCQHCANAPCEPVCPVYATYHNEEGLNTMVYNRCVGTRYCSNNCSYKVRRFNWFDYKWPKPLDMQLNPDVTVREVGVMEKCSFCVQRIKDGQNTAKNEGRLVKDGEIQPACASSCPTKAISFGNLKDEQSEVYQNSQSIRSYKILDFDLNTQPAISYLARVTPEDSSAKG